VDECEKRKTAINSAKCVVDGQLNIIIVYRREKTNARSIDEISRIPLKAKIFFIESFPEGNMLNIFHVCLNFKNFLRFLSSLLILGKKFHT
jgi:hypothetical protein